MFIIAVLVTLKGQNLLMTKKYEEHERQLTQVSKIYSNLPLVKSAKKQFSYFSAKTYVVSTQKNSLNETVLLSTQNVS